MLRKNMTNKKLFTLFLVTIITTVSINIFYSRSSSGASIDSVAQNWSDDVSLIEQLKLASGILMEILDSTNFVGKYRWRINLKLDM